MRRIGSLCLTAILVAFALTAQAEAARSCIGKRSLTYIVQKKLESCNQAITRAQARNRKERLGRALMERAIIHFDTPDYDAALRDARAALAAVEGLETDDRDRIRIELAAHMLAAFVHDRRRDKEALSASIDRVAGLDLSGLKHGGVLASLAASAKHHDMLDKIAEVMTASLSMKVPEKERHVLLMTRGVLHWKLEKLQAAEADLKASLKIKEHWSAHVTLARVYRIQKKYDSALDEFEAAFKREYFDPEIMKIAASLYNHSFYGTPSEYISESPRRVLSPRPIGNDERKAAILFGQLLIERCEMLLDMERTDEASKDCDRAVSMFPRNLVGLDALHRLALARGQTEEAERQARLLKVREAREAREKEKKEAQAAARSEAAAKTRAAATNEGGPAPARDKARTKELIARGLLPPGAAHGRNQVSKDMRSVYTVLFGT